MLLYLFSLSLCISNGNLFFINFLVYSVCLFSLTLSFRALFGVCFSNFQTSFHLIFVFSYSHVQFTEKINSIKHKTTNLTRGGRRSPPFLTFSRAILGPLLFISVLLPALSFRTPSLLHRGPNSLQLGRVSLLTLHQVPEGLPDSSVLLHEIPECLFNGT